VYESTIGAFGGVVSDAYTYSTWQTSKTLSNPSTVTLNGEIIKTGSEHFWWTATDKVLAADSVNKFSVDSGTYGNVWAIAGLAVMIVYTR
jgi:hypothetical protein